MMGQKCTGKKLWEVSAGHIVHFRHGGPTTMKMEKLKTL